MTPPSLLGTLAHAITIGDSAQSKQNMIATPLPGGGVIIDSTVAHHQLEGEGEVNTSHSIALSVKEKRSSRSFFSFSFDCPSAVPSFLPSSEEEPPTQSIELPPLSTLSAEEEVIERAYQEATRFQTFFSQLDRSGDKFISLEELKSVLPSEGIPLSLSPPSLSLNFSLVLRSRVSFPACGFELRWLALFF
jgi:hypothetical protein